MSSETTGQTLTVKTEEATAGAHGSPAEKGRHKVRDDI